jgi:hypothetical protein
MERYKREEIRDHFEEKHTLADLRGMDLVYYVLSEESYI